MLKAWWNISACELFVVYGATCPFLWTLICDFWISIFVRDWSWPDRLWNILLLSGNHFLFWQGAHCNGQCKFAFIKILERLGLTGRSYYQPVLIMPFQILFLSGLGLTIGLKSTMQFFTTPKNYKVWQTPILLELLPIDMTNIPFTVPWTGYNLIWRWIFPGTHWVAFFWHALGGIWLYCTLQVQ